MKDKALDTFTLLVTKLHNEQKSNLFNLILQKLGKLSSEDNKDIGKYILDADIALECLEIFINNVSGIIWF